MVDKELQELCGDVFNTLFPQKTRNDSYESIKARIRKCPKEWCEYGLAKVIPESLWEDFDCCPELLEGETTYRTLKDCRRFVKVSVLPNGNKTRTQYKFIVVDDNE